MTIVLKAADAGSGFTGTAHDTTTDDDLGSCFNHDPLLSGTDYPTQANGEDLTTSADLLPSTDVKSSVRIAPTVEAATAAMASIKAPGVLACLTDLSKASGVKKGFTVSSLTFSPLTVAAVGDDVFAFKQVATVTQSGTTIHVTEYGLLVRKGRVLNQLMVDGFNVVPPLSLASRSATTMVARAAAVR